MLFHVLDYAHKRDFLLFDTLSDQIILEQMSVMDVAADIADLILLSLQKLLGLPCCSREKMVWDLPWEDFFEVKNLLWRLLLLLSAPFIKDFDWLLFNLLCRTENLGLTGTLIVQDIGLVGILALIFWAISIFVSTIHLSVLMFYLFVFSLFLAQFNGFRAECVICLLPQDRETCGDQHNFRMAIYNKFNFVSQVVVPRVQSDLWLLCMLQQKVAFPLHIDNVNLVNVTNHPFDTIWLLWLMQFDDLYSQC